MAFTAGSIHKPAVVSTHHQRWVHSSPTVYEPAVMSPLITAGFETGGDDPSYHHRLKSNAPQTDGDAHFEPAVMGGAGVVVQALVTKGIIATVVKNKNRGTDSQQKDLSSQLQ